MVWARVEHTLRDKKPLRAQRKEGMTPSVVSLKFIPYVQGIRRG
jgi:hypothetical protein